MPKVNPLITRKAYHKDFLLELINRYQRQNKATSDDLGDALGITPEGFRRKKSKGLSKFTLQEFKVCCDRMRIPPEETAEAVLRFLEQ